MNVATMDRKAVGAFGERAAETYLKRHGFRIEARNVARKTGELDLIARKGQTLHFVEVKTMTCDAFPSYQSQTVDEYDPSLNLHEAKIRKVARTAEWYVANVDWEGDWQVDGMLVWLRRQDGHAKVRYLPQIV